MEFTSSQIQQILFAFNYDYSYRSSLTIYLNSLTSDPNYGATWFGDVSDLLTQLEAADVAVTEKTQLDGLEFIRVDGEYTARYAGGSASMGANVSRRSILNKLELLINLPRNTQPKLVRG